MSGSEYPFFKSNFFTSPLAGQAAAELFEESHNADKHDGRTILLWALLEKRRGNLDAARNIFQKDLGNSKQNPILHQVGSMLWAISMCCFSLA